MKLTKATLVASFFALMSAPAVSDNVGTWDTDPLSFANENWPDGLCAIHMIHMPPKAGHSYGRILMYGLQTQFNGTGDFGTQAYVWDTDPNNLGFIQQDGTALSLDPQEGMFLPGFDMFCGSHCGLADGNIFFAGGERLVYPFTGINFSGTFGYESLLWTQLHVMNSVRWYPTATTLFDGSVLATAGEEGGHTTAWIPEVYNVGLDEWTSTGAMYNSAALKTVEYPFMFSFYNDQTDYPAAYFVGKLAEDISYPECLSGYSLQIDGTPEWELKNTSPQQGGGAVMIIRSTDTVDKGLIFKGGGLDPADNEGIEATTLCATLDLQDWPSEDWNMYFAELDAKRIECNFVLLPDGHLVAIGGSSVAQWWGGTDYAVYETEWIDLLDPNDTWHTLAEMPTDHDPRMYHSTAVVDEFGKVLSAGCQSPIFHFEFDTGRFFNPPYLTSGLGRPVFSSVPTVIHYGTDFNITKLDYANAFTEEDPGPEPITPKVTLLRLGAATHGFDQNQRLVNCDYVPHVGYAGGLTVTPPANGHIAPPGYYMLTYVDAYGTPTVSKYVQLTN